MNSSIIVPISLLLLHLVILLVAFIFVVRLSKRFFRRPTSANIHGYIFHSKLISVGLIAILFTNTLNYCLLKPFSILINNVITLGDSILNNEVLSAEEVINLQILGKPFTAYFDAFPLSSLLFAIALGVIIYNGVTSFFKQEKDQQVQPPATRPNALFYNLTILSILAFSLFLVISVFISIPYLNEIKKPPLFGKNSLDTTLNTIRLLDTGSIKKQFETKPFGFSSIKDIVIKDSLSGYNYKQLNQDHKREIDANIQAIDKNILSVETRRKTAINQLKNSTEQYLNGKKLYLEKLKRGYETALQSNTTDKDLMFTMSVNAYTEYIKAGNSIINQAYINFANTDDNNEAEIIRLVSMLQTSINLLLNPPRDTTSYFLPDTYPRFNMYDFSFLDELNHYDVTIIPNKKDGSDWDFFGLIARYLIRTESLELVLLIGMLGFGLLGASFSSFQSAPVNPDDKNKKLNFLESFKTVPMVNNFWNVLVRGFLAAILVYLATKGGVVILTGDIKTDPNGYVLLFICFLGSVFSEKVWNSVKEKYNL